MNTPPPFSVRGKRVLVMGLGVHQGGLGVTQWLVRHGAHVIVTDVKSAAELRDPLTELRKYHGIQYVLGKHRMSDFLQSDLIIQNPAVPHHSQYLAAARKRGIAIRNEASLFFQITHASVVGVTGTKGKSTTTSYIGQLLAGTNGRVATVGNIRQSFFSVVDRFGPKDRIVAELSSWHIEGMAQQRQSPHIAVLTNVHEDHLNRYRSFSAYAKTKGLLFAFQGSDDCAILNRDNPWSRKIGKTVPGKRFWFSRRPFSEENGCFMDTWGVCIRIHGREQRIAPRTALQSQATDDIENLLAAVIAAYLAGASIASLRKRIPHLRPMESRRQIIRRLHGRTFVNDTTATAPIATIRALESIATPLILILGGENKNVSYAELGRLIARKAKAVVLLPGSASVVLAAALRRSAFPYVRAENMRAAVRAAWKGSSPGDTIVLSPAAASFNLFRNEFHRGDVFRDAVQELR